MTKDQKLPFGLYEQVLTKKLTDALQDLETVRWRMSKLPPDESHIFLNRYVSSLVKSVLLRYSGSRGLERQLQFINRIVDVLAMEMPDQVSGDDHATEHLLQELYDADRSGLADPSAAPRPSIPLSNSELIVNAPGAYRIGWELQKEIPSADRIDLLCSFIKWSGLRLMERVLKEFLDADGQLRVITTVYMGATDRRALDRLVEMGADVKVSHDTQRTRLHAKAWLLHRNTGYTTAYIGSSNLSESAQLHGLEWNVRASAVDAPRIVHKFGATFETYWEDAEFRSYSANPKERATLDRMLLREKGLVGLDSLVQVDIRPYPFQQEMLERLAAERFVHGRTRNLIVAATGTGKTVVAALDFRRLRSKAGVKTLLFVAHRKEILQQSRAVFRLVLKDQDFGELLVEGRRPERGRQLFASVQSLSRVDLRGVDPKVFDVLIVDEFHHAAAKTYDRLLKHFQPRFLLGLTATPERADGHSVLHWFDDRTAAELRLWDAIDLRLLAPFHYYGIHDGVDLSGLTWARGRYNQQQLLQLYNADQHRVRLIIQAVHNHVADVSRMRALGFCVGVVHARFMARQFVAACIPALAVTGHTPRDERRDAVRKLRMHEVSVLFTVDVFSEGVDIPEVDTVLFLRPTESPTVFLQQLGRGLRRHEDKECLTVLDFIGMAHRKFSYDVRFQALMGDIRTDAILHHIEEGFPELPAGCAIQLDRISQEVVLRNVRQAVRSNRTSRLVRVLRQMGPGTDLAAFLKEVGLDSYAFYRGDRTMTKLRRQAGFDVSPPGPGEKNLGRALRRLLHVDEPERLAYYTHVLHSAYEPEALPERNRRRLMMLLCMLFGRPAAGRLAAEHARLGQHPALCHELRELMAVLAAAVTHSPRPAGVHADVPLALHCRYSRGEIMAAFAHVSASGSLIQPQEGVVFHEPTRCNLLFVTINKTRKEYSPTTMYHDYAVSARLFHWQSQGRTRAASLRGERHTRHRELGITPLLFCRKHKRRQGVTEPYLFLGPVDYDRHEGERPMNVLWRLRTPMPADFLRVARIAK